MTPKCRPKCRLKLNLPFCKKGLEDRIKQKITRIVMSKNLNISKPTSLNFSQFILKI